MLCREGIVFDIDKCNLTSALDTLTGSNTVRIEAMDKVRQSYRVKVLAKYGEFDKLLGQMFKLTNRNAITNVRRYYSLT